MSITAGWHQTPAVTASVTRWTGPQGQTAVTFGDVSNADDVILMIHGMAGSKERFLSLALDCVAAGKAVVAVDLPYHGARRSEPHGSIMLYPPHPQFMKVSASVCNTLLAELPATLAAVGVTKPVSVLGHSLGGRIAYHMALRNLDVQRVISVGSPIGVESIPKGATFTEKDYGYWQEIDPFAGTADIRRVPITFIHGEKDKVCPLFTIERLQAQMRETSPDVQFDIKIVPGAGHEFVGALEAAALAELIGA